MNAWNSHCIPGPRGGVPNNLASNTFQVTRVPSSAVPTTEELVDLHRRQGRSLTMQHVFGRDPLNNHPELQQLRERDFFQRYPNMEMIFESVLHRDGLYFKEAIHYFNQLTVTFSGLVH